VTAVVSARLMGVETTAHTLAGYLAAVALPVAFAVAALTVLVCWWL
jgi:hypothetical protein